MANVYHLPTEARHRLLALRQVVCWILDEDASKGFSERDLSCWIAPSLASMVRYLWCRPLTAVRKPFKYLGDVDCERVVVTKDWYNSIVEYQAQLKAELTRYRKAFGDVLSVVEDDSLPF